MTRAECEKDGQVVCALLDEYMEDMTPVERGYFLTPIVRKVEKIVNRARAEQWNGRAK